MPRPKSRSSQPAGNEYLDFVKTVHLDGIGLDSAILNINREALATASGGPGNAIAEVSGRHEAFDLAPNSFSVRGDYKVNIKGADGTEAVTIQCSYSASFSLDRKAKEKQIERFAGNEVRLVFWPYLRHFVSDTTARMSIPPLVLPLTSELRSHPSSSGRQGT